MKEITVVEEETKKQLRKDALEAKLSIATSEMLPVLNVMEA